MMSTENYVADELLPVSNGPLKLTSKLGGVAFDPSLHLQIEFPSGVKNLKFEDISYPFLPHETLHNGLAYTKPFRILSDAGVKAARESMEEHIPTLGRSNNRASKYVRGLGYVSQFHRDLAYSPKVLELLSDFADETIYPHSMTMNISHCNIGEIATGKPVDKWHVDSVDYVLIIILSDLTDMVGGELRVLQQPNDKSGTFFSELSQRGIPAHIPIETVNYIGAGYGLFMQGSKIFHTVNGVLSAREPRISLVNSYMSGRPFAEDLTRYNTFADGSDGKEISDVEYARHKAWRIRGQMQFLIDHLSFTNSSSQQIGDMLFNASVELAHAAHLIQGEENDNARWIDEVLLLQQERGGVQSPKRPSPRQSPLSHFLGSGGSRQMRALSLSPMRQQRHQQQSLLSPSFSLSNMHTTSTAFSPTTRHVSNDSVVSSVDSEVSCKTESAEGSSEEMKWQPLE